MVEPVSTSAIIAASALKMLDAIVSDAWLRYFFVLGVLTIDNIAGSILGVYTVEGFFSLIVSLIIPGFNFPIVFGISSLLLLWGFVYPIVIIYGKDKS